jgi:hypothetical protein
MTWVLIVWATSGITTLPGYYSREECEKAASEITEAVAEYAQRNNINHRVIQTWCIENF